MFMRTPRSFVGHQTPLVRPRASAQLDYEGELVLIIGKAGRHIAESAALDHIAAVTLCNEGTIRDWVRHAKFNVTQGKNFDSTGSLGPWIVPYINESQIADIHLTTHVYGLLVPLRQPQLKLIGARPEQACDYLAFGFAR